MNKIRKKNKIIGIFLFLIYLILLGYLLFFSEAMGRAGTSTVHSYNLELFKEIKRFFIYRDRLGIWAFVLNVIGNVVAFIPFGFFRPIVGRRKHSFLRTVFQGSLFSVIIEVIQFKSNVGSLDVDDVFLNTLGCMLGYFLFLISYTAYGRIGKYRLNRRLSEAKREKEGQNV